MKLSKTLSRKIIGVLVKNMPPADKHLFFLPRYIDCGFALVYGRYIEFHNDGPGKWLISSFKIEDQNFFLDDDDRFVFRGNRNYADELLIKLMLVAT